ncbi:hypothetical protein TNCV_4843341 [Trichonephila clavipes]|uniref:Uncharacterized protein n=1 Tax=Trichonephila clavipes TaxID=2585209 RepID=A0A8X6WIW5_TRICX|nr:hypothetical protein TNCV_4843341 [Trichonephila clavipes]
MACCTSGLSSCMITRGVSNIVTTIPQESHEYPTYSPELSPCKYHIFDPLKKALNGWGFSYNHDVEAVVEFWFHNQLRSFFT